MKGPWPNCKIKLSDKELLELFRVECNSFTYIGELAGVSRERIRQVYNSKFRKLLGTRRTGHQRTKICTRKQYAMSKEQALPTDDATLVAYTRALEEGLDAQLCFRLPDHSRERVAIPRQKTLVVDGHRVHVSTASYWAGKPEVKHSGYWRVDYPRRKKFSLLVAVINNKDCMVFTRKELDTAISCDRPRLYVRVDREWEPYNNLHPRIDAWKGNLEAWHLFKERT